MSEPVTGERAAFTAWFNDAHSNTNITWINPNWPCGHPDVEAAWDAWQGARATLTRDLASARTALAEAKGVLAWLRAAMLENSDGEHPITRYLTRIDALVGGEGV